MTPSRATDWHGQIDAWEQAGGIALSGLETLRDAGSTPEFASRLGRCKSLGALLGGVTAGCAHELATACGLRSAAHEPYALAAAFPTIVELEVGQCALTGSLSDVVNASQSRSVLVRIGDCEVARVGLSARGVRCVATPAIGCHAAGLARVTFEHVELAPNERGRASADVLAELDRRKRLLIARGLCAWSRALLDDTVEFLTSRRFAARRLVDQQVVRHQLSEIVAQQKLLEAQAARAERAEPIATWLLADVASKTLPRFVKACQQLHGGRGFLNEYWVSRAYRDSLCLALLLGPADELYAHIARHLAPDWLFEE